MAPITADQEISCSLPPQKLFKAFVLDANELMPKVIPNFFKSFETIEGDGGVGSVMLVTFAEGSGIKPAKHKIVELDEENHVFKYNLIEGGILGDDLESVSYVLTFDKGADGGCVIKIAATYHPKKDDHEHGIIKEIIEKGKEATKGFIHAIEAHLHGHT
ncbi:major allergen Pru av 1-like [Salvia hispanica]|uniref:major allergen Pru av 1-like n=1 Tax=Salvia hispanica TaxID=49212 RepID=UPI0020095EFA|nr:major allergen Pru av 1-like [Salvia hispanica]